MMRDENNFASIASETLCILEHCDKSFLEKIPAKILNKLKSLRTTSSTNIKIYKNKKLEEQDISEDTKNFIALLYYNYVASIEEKKDIMNIWKKNDNIYTENIKVTNLFESKKEISEPIKQEKATDNNTEIVVYKENKFIKILQKIKQFFINRQ